MRLSFEAVQDKIGSEWVQEESTGAGQSFFDFEMRGGDVLRLAQSTRTHFPGATTEMKQRGLDSALASPYKNPLYDAKDEIVWWEKDNWYCNCIGLKRSKPDYQRVAEFAQHVIDVLIVILQDRNVNRVESEPRPPSKKWKRSGFYHSAQDVTETTLYCPRRISTADHGGTHASPRMHYRAEHTKMQPHGPRHSLRKEITVAATWVNAVDIDPSELGTPIKLYRLVNCGPACQIAQPAANEKHKKTFDREYKARFEKQLALAAAEHDPD
jgi:hypothetical protein